MYSVSDKYLNKIRGNNRNIAWSGTITCTDNTVINFDMSNIVAGSGKLQRSVAGATKLEIGTVYAAEFDCAIYTDASRYKFYDAQVTLSFTITFDDDTTETVPCGIFTIAEAMQETNNVSFKAYDNMLKFDKVIETIDTTARTPYQWYSYICTACGVTLGSTSSDFTAVANSTETFVANIEADTSVSTYRDLLAQITVVCGACAQIGRDGKLYILSFHRTRDLTITASQRYSSKVSDFVTYYTGMYAGYGDTNEYYHLNTDDGLYLDIGVNAFLQIENDTNRARICQAIISEFNTAQFTPFTITTPCDPALDPLDVIEVMGYNFIFGFSDTYDGGYINPWSTVSAMGGGSFSPWDAGASLNGGEIESAFGGITDISIILGGRMTIKCVGENPRFVDVKNRASKSLENMGKRIEYISETAVDESMLNNRIATATSAISGIQGGHVVIWNNATELPDEPNEILVMDGDSIDTAQRVWRFNANGLGYSATGYTGEYITAALMDGSVNAEVIKTGRLESDLGDSYWDLDTGELNVANGEVGDLSIENGALTASMTVQHTYTLADITRATEIVGGQISPTEEDYELYDIDGDGSITSADVDLIRDAVNNGGGEINSTITINPRSTGKAIEVTSSLGGDTTIGTSGVRTNALEINGKKVQAWILNRPSVAGNETSVLYSSGVVAFDGIANCGNVTFSTNNSWGYSYYELVSVTYSPSMPNLASAISLNISVESNTGGLVAATLYSYSTTGFQAFLWSPKAETRAVRIHFRGIGTVVLT